MGRLGKIRQKGNFAHQVKHENSSACVGDFFKIKKVEHFIETRCPMNVNNDILSLRSSSNEIEVKRELRTTIFDSGFKNNKGTAESYPSAYFLFCGFTLYHGA